MKDFRYKSNRAGEYVFVWAIFGSLGAAIGWAIVKVLT